MVVGVETYLLFHNPPKCDRMEVVLVLGKLGFGGGGFALNYFVRRKPNGYYRGRKMNIERYAFDGELPTVLVPATLSRNLPSLTTRPKGIVFKLGSFIFTLCNVD